MKKTEKVAFIITNAELLSQDVTKASLEKMNTGELDSLVTEIKNNPSFEESESSEEEEIVLQGVDIYTTKSGKQIEVLKAYFTGKVNTKINRGVVNKAGEAKDIVNMKFMFMTSFGDVSIQHQTLLQAYSAGILTPGYEVLIPGPKAWKEYLSPSGKVTYVLKNPTELRNSGFEKEVSGIVLEACEELFELNQQYGSKATETENTVAKEQFILQMKGAGVTDLSIIDKAWNDMQTNKALDVVQSFQPLQLTQKRKLF